VAPPILKRTRLTCTPVRRAVIASAVLACFVLAAAGCGSSKPKGPESVLGKGATAIYQTPNWAVVVKGSDAVAVHRVNKKWQADRSGIVKVEILGPNIPQQPNTQVAAQLISKTDLVESDLWIDGVEVPVKGGGTPTRGTIYGALDAPLYPGKHLLVAYARTADHATAVSRVFKVVAP
jgi:hypothetical protein